MGRELIALTFDTIMQTRAYTVIILEGRSKRFAIYVEPSIGKMIQMHLTGAARPRPLTHDLIYSLVQGFSIQVKQVVINDVQETIYFARLFLERKVDDINHILEIDARPSDCIALALMSNAPLFCTRDVLEKTIPVED